MPRPSQTPPARLLLPSVLLVLLALAVICVPVATAAASPPTLHATYHDGDWWWPDDDGYDYWDPADPIPTAPTGPSTPTGPTAPTGPSAPTGDPGWDDQPWVPDVPPPPHGAYARMAADGRRAIAPRRAPRVIKNMIRAANRLTKKPYLWGGGHGSWIAKGYDCSGSTSYVLHAVGLVDAPMVSGGYKSYGGKGRGKWVSIFANNGHVFMYIAGLRFDTSGRGEHGPRWRTEGRYTKGFKVRHPFGL